MNLRMKMIDMLFFCIFKIYTFVIHIILCKPRCERKIYIYKKRRIFHDGLRSYEKRGSSGRQ